MDSKESRRPRIKAHYDIVQGSEEWKRLRLGIPTASQFHRIVTPKTGKLSKQAEKYATELAVETFTGKPFDENFTQYMSRGSFLEEKARQYYELITGNKITYVGFVEMDNGQVGCSPDGLVGDDGMIEIKCLSKARHAAAMVNPTPLEHRPQIQGGLWICDRKWCDRIYYNGEMPSLIIRVERDEPFIKQLNIAILGQGSDGPSFLKMAEEAYAKIVQIGSVHV